MINFLQKALIEPFYKLSDKIQYFLPNLFVAILILLTGIVAAVVVRLASYRLMRAVGVDRAAEKLGAIEYLRKSGIKDPVSAIASRAAGWLIIIAFSIVSLSSIEVPATEKILERFVLYLPNIFIAAVIVLVGYLLGNFLGRAALIASVNAGFKASGLVGRLTKWFIVILSLTMALEQLGIGNIAISIAFAVMLGGLTLALSIAFGLGGKDIARGYLEKMVKGERKDDINHL